jgi:tetratricopeptide (TPR) repeat protein
MKETLAMASRSCFVFASLISVFVSAGFSCIGLAAQPVSVFQTGGSAVRGEITGMSPDTITVRTDNGDVDVPVGNLRNITFSQPPPEMSRAMNRFNNQRFDEGLSELQQLVEPPDGDALRHELDYLAALGAADSALTGGKIPPADAGKAVSAFLAKYPRSFYTWPLTERLGQLYVAVGRNDLAAVEFGKLVASSSPEYQIKGDFQVGVSKLAAEDTAGAESSLARVIASTATGDEADLLRTRARPLQAKALALSGKTAEARQAVEQLIAAENPDNTALFAEAYNTLGICHFRDGQMKEAALAFLHTDLLYDSQAEAHAEALWYLATIMPQIGYTEEGWQARENLQRLYKNSPWATKTK